MSTRWGSFTSKWFLSILRTVFFCRNTIKCYTFFVVIIINRTFATDFGEAFVCCVESNAFFSTNMMPVPWLDPSPILHYPSGPLFVFGHFVYLKLIFLISVMAGNTWCPLFFEKRERNHRHSGENWSAMSSLVGVGGHHNGRGWSDMSPKCIPKVDSSASFLPGVEDFFGSFFLSWVVISRNAQFPKPFEVWCRFEVWSHTGSRYSGVCRRFPPIFCSFPPSDFLLA